MDPARGGRAGKWEEPLFPDETSDQVPTDDAAADNDGPAHYGLPIHATGPLSAEGRAVSGQSTLVIEGDVIPRRLRRPADLMRFALVVIAAAIAKDPGYSPESLINAIRRLARYRQEDMGRAALWYQRAQLLEPLNPEVRQNLRHLDEKLRFFRFGEGSPLAEWSLLLNKNTWVIAASAGVWLILLALMRWILASSQKGGSGAYALILSLIGILVFIPSATFAAIRPEPGDRVKDVMVVTAREVSAYTSATITSGNVIALPPGSQVRLLEKRGAWSYVEVPSGDEHVRGWVESATYTPLWPWDMQLLP